MAITIHLKGGVPILEPNGKIVGPVVSELREKLALWLDDANAPYLLINFEHIHKIDSSCLGMLVHVHDMAARKGTRIGLINVGKHIKNLLILSRLMNVFEHFDTEDAAITAFAPTLKWKRHLNP